MGKEDGGGESDEIVYYLVFRKGSVSGVFFLGFVGR